MAARKPCQAGAFVVFGGREQLKHHLTDMNRAPRHSEVGKHNLAVRIFLGTNRQRLVSNTSTGNPVVWKYAATSATPIPTPGGDK
jgi:hypothetical protein